METTETRAKLLAELATMASPGLVADVARLDTDAQIRALIASGRAQEQFYRDCGFEDMAKAKA